MRRPGVTDAELDIARDVIRRYYREWVESTAADLIKRVYQERWTRDGDEFQMAAHEVADSAMTYYSDQYLTIYATESHDEALEQLRDTGNELPDNFPAPWAYYAFQVDLNAILQGADVLEPYHDGQDADEQLAWLLEAHGKCFYRKTVNGRLYEAWFIGVVAEDTREEVDFGVLIVNDDADDEWLSVARLMRGGEASSNKDPEVLRVRGEISMAWDAMEARNGSPDPKLVDPAPDEPEED